MKEKIKVVTYAFLLICFLQIVLPGLVAHVGTNFFFVESEYFKTVLLFSSFLVYILIAYMIHVLFYSRSLDKHYFPFFPPFSNKTEFLKVCKNTIIVLVIAILLISTVYVIGDRDISTLVDGKESFTNKLLLFIGVVLVASFIEEFVARGICLYRLKMNFSSRISIIVCALFWSLAHLEAIIYVFPLGLLFSYYTIRSNSYFPSVISHISINGIVFLFIHNQ